ncbi:hypothetical protein C5B89_06620 [Haloferax sp. Atlit-47N]|uniref:hypothetical protein n=1 Tax=Haloferax sp. Atlit-47N TaxID=2077199 RepID=UPI000E239651|nr:hypothetical protein [Haloferax sp. Atlit-47N]RDZ41610.1 hypothetical protein C5B89_06620 [Haloferax sp. Atlit-47N]
MIIDQDESGGGVPGGSDSIPDYSNDDDDNTVPTDDYDGTGGYGSIGDDDDDDDDNLGLDPGNSESGMPGGGDPANDAVSPDPNENSDGDEVTVNPDGSVSIDEDRLSGGYESVQDVVDEVRNIVGGGSSETPQVGEITALEEQLRNLRESLTGMGESTGDSSSGGLLAVGAAGVAVVVAIGAAVLAGGDDK